LQLLLIQPEETKEEKKDEVLIIQPEETRQKRRGNFILQYNPLNEGKKNGGQKKTINSG